ncbi:hypothetical protein DYB32_006978 [Aphanomyces invadans]|uniref:RING-type domain-containing protein n=1 Tax=Aphanomyces invadans TaxID=157072 RepID=A0A418AY66_9STRA|nr:hypothetical protein DYB32_006978 [Aphanomyces invadans]
MQALYMNRGRADMGFIQDHINSVLQAAPEMQETTTVRNEVNLKKQSLKLVALDSATARLEFVFDAGKPCTVTLFLDAIETIDDEGNSTFTSQKPANGSMKDWGGQVFPAGLGQSFASVPLSLADWTPSQLIYDGKSSTFPLVVEITVVADASVASRTQKQATFIMFPPATGSSPPLRKVQVIKQKVEVLGQTYELQEIYGMEGAACCTTTTNDTMGNATAPALSTSAVETDVIDGAECIICMCEPRNTTILPCRYTFSIAFTISHPLMARHMCICLECSEALKRPGSTCPICRGKVESMLQIRVNNSGPAAVAVK